jgi:hypothetical protein
MERPMQVVKDGPGETLQVFTMQSEGTDLGTIAIPVRDHLSAQTTTSLMMTDWSFLQPGQTIERLIVQGSILTMQRNECVQRMRGEWIMFIDDDMVWQPKQVGELIATRNEFDLDMLGALCYRRSEPHQPTLFMREAPTSGAYNYLERWDDDIIEVDATGMAFIVIHKRVFERIAGSEMPPYEVRVGSTPPNFFRWQGALGEDLGFCQDAKASGSRVWVDTRSEIGHVGEHVIGRRQFLTQLAFRPPEVVAERLRINTQMGLPTLLPDAALEQLKTTWTS